MAKLHSLMIFLGNILPRNSNLFFNTRFSNGTSIGIFGLGSHGSGAEQEKPPVMPGCASFDVALHMIGALWALSTCCQLVSRFFIDLYLQVLHMAALSPLIPQSVLMLGLALTQVQHFVHGVVELHEVHMAPLLSWPRSLWMAPLTSSTTCSTQLGALCSLAEGTLNPTTYVNEDIKQLMSMCTDAVTPA